MARRGLLLARDFQFLQLATVSIGWLSAVAKRVNILTATQDPQAATTVAFLRNGIFDFH